MRLTAAKVNTLRHDPSGPQTQIIWDEVLRGFGVRLHSSGARSFVVSFRVGRGRGARSRRATIDRTDRVSLRKAREIAQRWILDSREGRDPLEAARAPAQDTLFSELSARYLAEHAKPRKAPKSVENDESALRKHLLPAFGGRRLGEIRAPDVSAFLSRIGTTRPVQANRIRALLSKMFNLAEEWGLRPRGTNPTRGSKRFREKSRQVHVTGEQLRAILALLVRLRVPTAAAIRMMLYTGARPGEILPLRWEPDPERREPHLELERNRIVHPHSKTGHRNILLGPLALGLLAQLPRVGVYVFPSMTGEGPIQGVNKAWAAIRRDAGVPNLHLHDLRHVHATLLEECGAPFAVIQELLGHASPTTTKIYVNPNRAELQKWNDRVGEHFSRLLSGHAVER